VSDKIFKNVWFECRIGEDGASSACGGRSPEVLFCGILLAFICLEARQFARTCLQASKGGNTLSPDLFYKKKLFSSGSDITFSLHCT
jgi:hypothetical protein